MYWFALSGLVNALSATVLGTFVFVRTPDNSLHRIYALFCVAISIWSYAYFFWLTADQESAALFWSRTLMVGAIFIPITAFHHLIKLINTRIPRGVIIGNYALSFLLAAASFGPWIAKSVTQKDIFPYWPIPGPLFHLHLMQFAVLAVWGLLIIKRELKQAYGIRENQLKLLFLAEVVGWGGGLLNYPLWYDIPIRPYGNILVSLYTIIFAYAMVRYRLLDVEIVLKKSLIYALLLLVLLLPCYLLVVLGQLSAFGSINYVFSVLTLGLFILVGFFYPKVRFRTEEALERALFKKRVNYRETLLQSSRDMVSIVDINALSDKLVQTIGKSLDIEKVSLLLDKAANGSYHLEASVGLNLQQSEHVLLPKEGPLVQLLQRRREPIVREELEWVPVGAETPQTIATMDRLGAELSLPIISKDKLIGVLNLGHKEDRSVYSDEDLELLSTLTNQAAIAIENARLYENLKQSQDTLRRADRLSSLGLLTAGLAHEIRNPLVAIRTFTQLLPERYNDPEFREGFQGLALKEVDRICGLINDLLSFARPSKPNVAPENVNDVLDNIARILGSTGKRERHVNCARI